MDFKTLRRNSATGGRMRGRAAAFGVREEVWVSAARGARRIDMPADLINPPPTPFPVAALIQTEQDRWHSMGFDVAPYARLFSQVRRRIAGERVEERETAGNFA